MTANENLSAVLHGINDLRLEKGPVPVPKDNQVLLQMECVGICGSDVHFLVDGRIGPYIVEHPLVTGHEASGTVIKVGKNVKNLKSGDRVAIEPQMPCRYCNLCKSGNYHLCPDLYFCSIPPNNGILSRYYVHDADFCHKLPDNLDLEDGALMEPLSVGVHGAKIGDIRIGDVVLVLGAGPVGLTTLMAAKAMGATKTIVTDILDIKLKKAKELGANYTVKIKKGTTEDEVVEKIKELLGEEPNKTIDCSGVGFSIRVGLKVTRIKGVVVLVGLGKTEHTVPLANAIFREIEVRGAFKYNNDYPIAIDMVSTGKVNVKPLITHHYRIEEADKAFNRAKTQEGDPIKILIHPNPNWKPF